MIGMVLSRCFPLTLHGLRLEDSLKFSVGKKFKGWPAVEFIQKELSQYDLSELATFKLRDGTSSKAYTGQVWGACKCTVWRDTRERITPYSITVSLKGDDADFPAEWAK